MPVAVPELYVGMVLMRAMYLDPTAAWGCGGGRFLNSRKMWCLGGGFKYLYVQLR